MANRAERRRLMRESRAAPVRNALSARDEIASRLEEAAQPLKRGYSAMVEAERERYRFNSEARAKVCELIEQNGITLEDLDAAREQGRLEGFQQAGLPIIKSCYAGICLALHDEFGFGEERCYRAIKAVDAKILWALNNQELVDEVLEKTKLEFNFDEPFDRVTKAER